MTVLTDSDMSCWLARLRWRFCLEGRNQLTLYLGTLVCHSIPFRGSMIKWSLAVIMLVCLLL